MHSHGGSACAFRIVRGSAIETVLGSRDRVHPAGAVVEEGGAQLVHQVGNAAPDALVSLHAYAPPLPVDAPSPREGRNVVIVGGGASGVAVAIHLLRRGDPKLRVTIVERGPWLGRGIAYGVDSRIFRLNVPASKMSLDPATPDDFQRWASAAPGEMLPRTAFGAYVVERLAEAIRQSPAKLRIVRGEAVGVDAQAVRLAGGDAVPAEVAVAGGPVRHERYDRIVRCVGPALDRSEADAPLVCDLVASGRAAPDPAGLGVVTDDAGRVVDASGAASERLLAIGAPLRASAWETTSIPDIAVQAVAIASRIVPDADK